MPKVLEDLFFGRLAPHERNLRRSDAYGQAVHRCIALENELKEIIPADKCSILDDIADAFGKLNDLTRQEDFVCGFRLGAQIMAAVFLPDTSPLTTTGSKAEEQS